MLNEHLKSLGLNDDQIKEINVKYIDSLIESKQNELKAKLENELNVKLQAEEAKYSELNKNFEAYKATATEELEKEKANASELNTKYLASVENLKPYLAKDKESKIADALKDIKDVKKRDLIIKLANIEDNDGAEQIMEKAQAIIKENPFLGEVKPTDPNNNGIRVEGTPQNPETKQVEKPINLVKGTLA